VIVCKRSGITVADARGEDRQCDAGSVGSEILHSRKIVFRGIMWVIVSF